MSSTLDSTNTALMNVVIRADAGPTVGTGHVMRMMALGEACCKLGASVTMLCGDIPTGLVQRLVDCGIDVHHLTCSRCDKSDAREALDTALQLNADWIVLDGYGFDRHYQQFISDSNAMLLMMDEDSVADPEFVDVILNQNVYATETSSESNFLAGCQYTLLRSEFLSQAASEHKTIRQFARRIMVTLGGCDADNWTARVLRTLRFSGSDKLIVDVVLGAGYRHLEELLELKRALPCSIRIHRNVDRMVDVMQRVDFAITAGGSTCYELARCGVPALAIPTADNQLPIVKAHAQHGTLAAFDPIGNEAECVGQLEKQIKSLIRDPQRRASMSQAGRKLVDGKGAFRIARKMANWNLSFRQASLEDAELLLSWRNDPEVRSVSFNSDVMSPDTFGVWLQRLLDDQNRQLWIAESRNGQPIGKVEFDFQNPQQAVIELTLDHTRRGKGLGRAIIEKACKVAFDENPLMDSVVAQISPGNVASERAFRSVGFVQTQPTMVGKKLAFQFVLWRDNRLQTKKSVA